MISDFNCFSAYFRPIDVANNFYGKVSQGEMKMKRFSLFDSHFLLKDTIKFSFEKFGPAERNV